MSITLPLVSECSISGCSYNDHSSCNAAAVTIVADAECATFIPLTRKGGLPKVVAEVGACHRTDCVFNKSLECSASAVKIGPGVDNADHPGCMTYQAA